MIFRRMKAVLQAMGQAKVANEDILECERRVAYFVLRAGLFWNNGPIVQKWVDEEGIFYHHSCMSAGEDFFEFLCSVGVLINEVKRHRLVVRPDAIAGYAGYLINRGVNIEVFIDALVCVGGEAGWLETSRKPFKANFYEGSDAFDCRQLMIDLVKLGYAEKVDMAALGHAETKEDFYKWSAKMIPILEANFF
jgi:hypothetical protein